MLIIEQFFCYGSILNDNNNITLNNFCELTDSNENKFWSKVQRVSSNLESGLGKQQFLKASDKYKFLLEKDCKYAVSFFHEVNFLVELNRGDPDLYYELFRFREELGENEHGYFNYGINQCVNAFKDCTWYYPGQIYQNLTHLQLVKSSFVM